MKPIIVLAPLAGYTNVAYRRFMKKFGCDIVVSEMISDFALFYNNQETLEMIKVEEDERPVAIQLFGGSKEAMITGFLDSLTIVETVSNNSSCLSFFNQLDPALFLTTLLTGQPKFKSK